MDHPDQETAPAPATTPLPSCDRLHRGPFKRTRLGTTRCNTCDRNVSDDALLAVYRANGKINWGI